MAIVPVCVPVLYENTMEKMSWDKWPTREFKYLDPDLHAEDAGGWEHGAELDEEAAVAAAHVSKLNPLTTTTSSRVQPAPVHLMPKNS